MTKICILSTVAQLVATLPANAQRTYLDQTTIDRSVKPGADFFAYANGGWINANEIPATEASWGNGAIIRKQTRLRLQELVRKVAQQKNKPGSNAQKLQELVDEGRPGKLRREGLGAGQTIRQVRCR